MSQKISLSIIYENVIQGLDHSLLGDKFLNKKHKVNLHIMLQVPLKNNLYKAINSTKKNCSIKQNTLDIENLKTLHLN